jgi:hypothetical protein
MLMGINLRELVYGHQTLLEKSTNNNKYQNMMTLQTDDEDPDAYIIGEEHKNS